MKRIKAKRSLIRWLFALICEYLSKIFASIRYNSLQNIRFETKANRKNEIFASLLFNLLQNIRFEQQANLKDKIFASIQCNSLHNIRFHCVYTTALTCTCSMDNGHDIVSFAIFASDRICSASICLISYSFRFYLLIFASYHIRFASIHFYSLPKYSFRFYSRPIIFDSHLKFSNLLRSEYRWIEPFSSLLRLNIFASRFGIFALKRIWGDTLLRCSCFYSSSVLQIFSTI